MTFAGHNLFPSRVEHDLFIRESCSSLGELVQSFPDPEVLDNCAYHSSGTALSCRGQLSREVLYFHTGDGVLFPSFRFLDEARSGIKAEDEGDLGRFGRGVSTHECVVETGVSTSQILIVDRYNCFALLLRVSIFLYRPNRMTASSVVMFGVST